MRNELFESDADGNLTKAGMSAADFDGDGDIDQADYTKFTQCFNGPNNPPAQTCTVDADFDDDGDVDIADYTALTGCYNGVNRPPSCNGPNRPPACP